ncbi:Lysophospholipase L1 [Enterococcus malodoratus]|uniref:GDSL-type esterase/lipase family protein n=1 Tax=Enterococcus malodoratus TaxID=71451 RepID=UPI0008B2C8D7|nr:GDSL-type esterase/lipase family protein [Enterococcus malodoratus]SET76743.1 Lysophospholipase L1 [Enterococcus malodoratus]
MKEETVKLTKLNPQIKEFQNHLRSHYDEENKSAKKGQIVFVGSSLMEIFPIEKFQSERNLELSLHIYNRGVRATTTKDVLEHLNTLIFDLSPRKIFMNIGTNDIGFGVSEEESLANYVTILTKIKEKLPETKVYVMKFYPINSVDEFIDPRSGEKGRYSDKRTNENLAEMSDKIGQFAEKLDYAYIDVNNHLSDSIGNLRKELTFDGAHMFPSGYEIVLDNLMPYLK